jgi:glycosyltransferase involved in cell wall biosynthesis
MIATRGGGVMELVLSLNPGGTERLVFEICTRLKDRFPLSVCCLDDEGLWGKDLRNLGVAVAELRRGAGFRPSLADRIARRAASVGASVIHCHHYTPFVYGALAKLRRRGLRVLYTEHGRLSDAAPSAKRRLANLVLRQLPDAVTAVSRDLREHMTAEGFRSADVEILHNGIPIPSLPTPEGSVRARATLGLPRGQFVVGSVGRLDPVKHFPALLDATHALNRDGIDTMLVIAGEGPDGAALRAHARVKSIQDRVRFLGHCSDVRALLPAFDVYVNSSIFEGVSLTILEAMAASLPIVATRVGGTPEVVGDGETGILVEARSAEAIASAVRKLHDDTALRARVGAAARARVIRDFDIERMVGRYADLYVELGGLACAELPGCSARMVS